MKALIFFAAVQFANPVVAGDLVAPSSATIANLYQNTYWHQQCGHTVDRNSSTMVWHYIASSSQVVETLRYYKNDSCTGPYSEETTKNGNYVIVEGPTGGLHTMRMTWPKAPASAWRIPDDVVLAAISAGGNKSLLRFQADHL